MHAGTSPTENTTLLVFITENDTKQ